MTEARRTRRTRRGVATVLAAIVAAVLVAAACSAEPGTTDGSAATTARAATAAPPQTPVRSEQPTATPRSTPPSLPSPSGLVVPHADRSLELLLPASIEGIPLIRMSSPGSDYDHGGDICSFVCPLEARLMAEGVGAGVDDVTLAFAFDERVEHYALVAFRVRGASGAELLEARIRMFDSEAPFPMIAEHQVGDDKVTVAVRSWFPDDTQFLVVRDDALIVIRYPTDIHDGAEPVLPDEVATIVAALP